MRPLPDAVLRLAADQNGIISRRQLLANGVCEDTIKYLLRPLGGPWQRVIRGVYATFSGQLTTTQRRRAALVYAGDNAVITGTEGCRALGFRYAPKDHVVTVLLRHDRHRQSRDFVVIERTWRMPERHWLVDGIAVAPPARCVLDASRRLTDMNAVQALIAESVQAQRASPAQLVHELEHAQINGTALPRRAIERTIRGAHSAQEGHFIELFRSSKILPPMHHNCRLRAEDGSFIALLDAYAADVGLGGELNSREFHFAYLDALATDERLVRVASYGVQILPLAPSRLRTDGVGYLRQFEAAYRARKEMGVRPRGVVVDCRPACQASAA